MNYFECELCRNEMIIKVQEFLSTLAVVKPDELLGSLSLTPRDKVISSQAPELLEVCREKVQRLESELNNAINSPRASVSGCSESDDDIVRSCIESTRLIRLNS